MSRSRKEIRASDNTINLFYRMHIEVDRTEVFPTQESVMVRENWGEVTLKAPFLILQMTGRITLQARHRLRFDEGDVTYYKTYQSYMIDNDSFIDPALFKEKCEDYVMKWNCSEVWVSLPSGTFAQKVEALLDQDSVKNLFHSDDKPFLKKALPAFHEIDTKQSEQSVKIKPYHRIQRSRQLVATLFHTYQDNELKNQANNKIIHDNLYRLFPKPVADLPILSINYKSIIEFLAFQGLLTETIHFKMWQHFQEFPLPILDMVLEYISPVIPRFTRIKS